ncbi:ABC transporter ATP-binding protein [Desmospora profundinema]|uniref:Oligopeptide/dipeptide ABC transporter ATP-binding protein n=1 Tax=Desmospora profundinema TaxID=1571184 RepID=A0ABU1IP20_9BACL|nr:ABC transporter ATP-binding protein [Desmospora profundinema]MDR6225704.1 oligopeptide/dipeptide ABC transporter ATP-binding protein [Desmospora profundinema]
MSTTAEYVEKAESVTVNDWTRSIAPVLQLSNLTIASVNRKGKIVKELVKEVGFSIYPGEMMGLVGESGSGKSVTAAAVMGMLPKTLRVTDGEISLNGTNLASLSEKERRRLRGKKIAYVFQNYQGSFTPFLKIGKQLVEAVRSHESVPLQEAKAIALEWLHRVQLPADRVYESYPFQLSGGQLQRASLAAALMMKPSLIIADEPTTALDVLNGKQVMDLLARLQKETHCAVLFISHDLGHVLKRTVRMAVMYGGRLMESGPTESIRSNPQHPYTQMLLQARPLVTARIPGKLTVIPGEPGAITDQGCPFALRCPFRIEPCTHVPAMTAIGKTHLAACHMLHTGGEEIREAAVGGQTTQSGIWR